MKTHFAVIALLFVTHSCKAQSQPPPSSSNAVQNTLTDAEQAAGWRVLFDGRTTAGWRNYGKPTISNGWKVQDGALTRWAPAATSSRTTNPRTASCRSTGRTRAAATAES